MSDAKVLELCTMGNLSFFRWLSRAFGAPLLYINLVAGILILVGWVASWYFNVSDTVGLLLWLVPLTVFVTSIGVGSFYAIKSPLPEDISEPAAVRTEPGVTMTAQPRIHFLGWETTEAPIPATGSGEVRADITPWLTRVTFANEPDVQNSGLAAYKVSGHIEFYDAARDRFLFGMVGQWSDDQDDEDTAIGDKQINFLPDATPCHLNIALKYDEDDECYGINHDTAVRAPADLRDEQRKLGHGLYTIKIMIHGENVAETFWFGLINRGSGQRVRILRISS